MYWAGITMIEAQNNLVSINVAGYPWMSKEHQKKFHKNMHKLAYPVIHEIDNKDPVSLEELATRLGALING